MKKEYIYIIWILNFANIHAQSEIENQKNFSFQVSAGPNFYFNNLELFHDNVQLLNYSSYSRIMWNTKYRLSFGLESGYIRLYEVAPIGFDADASSSITSIPIHLAINMKFHENFYFSGTFGPSYMINKLVSKKGEQITDAFSIADCSIAFGYRYDISNYFYISTEIKYFYSSKAEDRNLSIPVNFGYNF